MNGSVEKEQEMGLKIERGSGTYDLLQYYMCACIILMKVVKWVLKGLAL